MEVPEAGATGEQGCANVSLQVHDEALAETQDVSMHWKVTIPKFLKADTYQGSVSFSQAPDECLNFD